MKVSSSSTPSHIPVVAISVLVEHVVDTCAIMSQWRHAACAPLPLREYQQYIPKPVAVLCDDVYNKGVNCLTSHTGKAGNFIQQRIVMRLMLMILLDGHDEPSIASYSSILLCTTAPSARVYLGVMRSTIMTLIRG